MPFTRSRYSGHPCHTVFSLAGMILLVAAAVACDGPEEPSGDVVIMHTPGPDYTGKVTRVLEDNVHSTKQNSTITSRFWHFQYDQSHGYSKAFASLYPDGFAHHRLVSGRLSPEMLAGYDVYFLNLTDRSRPAFTPEEIDAIVDFVEKGGAMVVITDHTNCYRSAERTGPLVERFGWSLPYVTLNDRPPDVFKGNHWVFISRFADHPVTAGLRRIGLFGAGAVEGPGSVAFSSENAWGDRWNPDAPPSYWGNWIQDADEPSGVLSAVNVAETGAGRAVIVSDQNIFGNAYLGFADNLELWKNIFRWCAFREQEPSPEPLRRMLAMDGRVDGQAAVNSSSFGYLALHEHLGRQDAYWVRAFVDLPASTPDLLFLLEPSLAASPEDPASARSVLEAGGQVILFLDPLRPSAGALDLLREMEIHLSFLNESGEELDLLGDPATAPGVSLHDGGQVSGEFLPTRGVKFDGFAGFRVAPPFGATVWFENSHGVRGDFFLRVGSIHIVLQPRFFRNQSIWNGKQLPGDAQEPGLALLEGFMGSLTEM